MDSDKKIWDDFRNGKNNALSHIYFEHVQILFRYGRKFSHDDDLIKDIIQDLFFDLLRTRQNLGTTDNISFYLIASFRRKLTKTLNKNKLVYSDPGKREIEAEIVYSVEHDFIRKEELTRREISVHKGMAKLSPKQREILFYRFVCDFDYDQICDIMKLKYDSARKQLSRALKSMKKALDGTYVYFLFFGFSGIIS